jgi:metallophosphoesterase (TIGR03767 family)
MTARAAAVVLAALALAAPAAAQSTLDRTIVPVGGGAFEPLAAGPGEGYVVRRAPGVRAKPRRTRTRRSLLYFGQLTDPQILDEVSPIRVDFLDQAGGDVKDGWRPNDVMATQTFDQVVRAMNAQRVSRVRGRGGRRARMALAIGTGDLIDNQQLNEARWMVGVLRGGVIDPFSGKPIGPGNTCDAASAEEVARMNADVAARRYTGVGDFGDWPASVPPERYAGFWDPNRTPPEGTPPGLYDGWPRYPGLYDRAQQPFTAAGLDVPPYLARGNHDGLLEGTIHANNPLIRPLATGCIKVFPGDAVDPVSLQGDLRRFLPLLRDPETIRRLLEDAQKVPPDPDRRVIDRKEYKRVLGPGTGLRHVDRRENRASGRTASYYSFAPRRGLRFVSIDTVAEGGSSDGNVDHPQYEWLRRELRRAHRRDELVVVYGHHTLATMDATVADEAAGDCATPGCDEDPRRSTPIHRGLLGDRPIRDLLLKAPNVIAYVAGHTHNNEVNLHRRARLRLWEVATASHVDWPQQSRTLEIFDNRDGTLSLFGTIVDHAAPADAPPPGPAAAFTEPQLASLSRAIAHNDPQRPPKPPSGEPSTLRAGTRADRNVELVIRDPRRRRRG